jgi:hypothetical protein
MAANAGTKLHGKNGGIYINGPKGAGTKVSLKSEWTLNLNRDYVDSTTFGDGNKTYLAGLKDISGTYAGLMDQSGDLLVNATSSDSVETYLYSDDRTGSEVLLAWGPALHDSAINCSNTDAVRVSGNFRANGLWTVLTGS